MTRTEFEEWIEYHCQAFPTFREDFSSGTRNISQWYGTLRRVSLKCAKQATMEMLGDPPKFLNDHPSVVKKWAKAHNGIEGEQRPKPKVIDGQVTFTCDKCQDTGHISVFLPESMRAMRDGRFGWLEAHLLGAAACSCEWGRKLGEQQKLVILDDRHMVLAVCGNHAASLERLAAFFGVAMPVIDVPVHVRPHTEEPAPLPVGVKPVASLLASPQSRAKRAERVETPFEVEEANAAFREAEEPWTPDMECPF
jgi:hypothetical protein